MEILIGLGGNLGEPRSAFGCALDALAVEGRVTAVSRLWRTRAVGPTQPDFMNAAALIDWSSGPRRLLDRCREIEAAAGRNGRRKNGGGPEPSISTSSSRHLRCAVAFSWSSPTHDYSKGVSP